MAFTHLDPQDVRRWVRRLRYFTITTQRPKENEGDWLAVRWLLDDVHPRADLLVTLGLPEGVTGWWSGRLGEAAVDVAVWRDVVWLRPALTGSGLDLYTLTEDDVLRAEALERFFDERNLATWPRQADDLGWVTPATHPEVFDADAAGPRPSPRTCPGPATGTAANP